MHREGLRGRWLRISYRCENANSAGTRISVWSKLRTSRRLTECSERRCGSWRTLRRQNWMSYIPSTWSTSFEADYRRATGKFTSHVQRWQLERDCHEVPILIRGGLSSLVPWRSTVSKIDVLVSIVIPVVHMEGQRDSHTQTRLVIASVSSHRV